MASWLLNVYFTVSLRDVSDCITCYLRLFLFFATLICSLIPLLMSRNDAMFPMRYIKKKKKKTY
ncbi:hypothetical protein NC652_004272 [Populus alba x Populus x berolinensis]|nr:hypothetical protein NC652_004272 [Populus alba x Populus x berolinensis]